jgi:hypothetical protein
MLCIEEFLFHPTRQYSCFASVLATGRSSERPNGVLVISDLQGWRPIPGIIGYREAETLAEIKWETGQMPDEFRQLMKPNVIVGSATVSFARTLPACRQITGCGPI